VAVLLYDKKCYLGAVLEEVVSLSSELDFLENTAFTQHSGGKTVDSGLHHSAGSLLHAL